MAAIDFPNNPTVNQLFETTTGILYQYDGIKWNYISTEAEFFQPLAENAGKWLTTDGSQFLWDDLIK